MSDEAARRTAAYDYELPGALIASRPAERRDASRLLILDRESGRIQHAAFPSIASVFSPGDAVVVNDSKVFPARLLGRKPTGARAEILLIRPVEGGDVGAFGAHAPRIWNAMVRPGGKLKPGRTVEIGDGLDVEILDSCPDGTRTVRLIGEEDPWALIERFGHMPLPPYIERPDDEADRQRYQTVYAGPVGSVAAPTAGLHFTSELLASLRERGVTIVEITLHVGFGTFRPVSVDRVEEHRVSPEAYRVEPAAAEKLNQTKREGGRIWAVGTTSCRVLETIAASGRYVAGAGWTDLFIHPPYRFAGVGGLVTNFHLPRSSLLMLVAAFAGRRPVLDTYRTAVEEGYRFFSYGDAMVIS